MTQSRTSIKALLLPALAASVLLASALIPGKAVAAGNPTRGLEKSQVCQSCHGREGNQTLQDSYPILAGQHSDYLVHALKSYRDGSRQNAVMAGFASGLSDQDIADLAAWYSRQQGLTDLRIE